ncbi:MAG: hypothetical protein Q8Q09_03880 [Deltaproteobacteria bacterium]|nr:hypothetical protein [Deltaproteobacteria bacterium]
MNRLHTWLVLSAVLAACSTPPETPDAAADGSTLPDGNTLPDARAEAGPEAGPRPEAGTPDVVDTDVVDTDAGSIDVMDTDAVVAEAGADASAGDGGPVCAMTEIACSGVCVDSNTNAANCGACGAACGAGQSCSMGVCACPMGQTACGAGAAATCVNSQTDVANCGACGNACGMGQVCDMGMCRTPCVAPRAMCGAACVDTSADPANCGACGTACPMAQSCVMGACACPMGQTACGAGMSSACVDTTSDTNNCGACGATCGAGQTCAMGRCACPMGLSVCGMGAASTCNDLQTELGNCGACGTTCGAGQVCVAGACRVGCTAPRVRCGMGASEVCVDSTSDNGNCGACGRVCGSNATCTTSVCRPRNNTPATAIPLMVPVTGARVTVTGSTVNGSSVAGQCSGNAVYYSVTFAEPVYLYADTFGSPTNTVLGIRPAMVTATTVCNGNACGTTQSQTALPVPAGTHLIEVSGTAGAFTLNVIALPAGGGDTARIAPAVNVAQSLFGVTAGASALRTSCGNGNGPEDSYFFLSCPADPARTLQVTSCGSSYDTVLEVRSSNAMAPTCNDDANGSCGLGSNVRAPIGAGAGLHVVYVDGFGSSAGSYVVNHSFEGCAGPWTACGGTCVQTDTLLTDGANCGACGRACAAGLTCTNGVCGSDAAPPTTFLTNEGGVQMTANIGSVVDGAPFSDACPNGQYLVGVRGTTNALRTVASVEGVCATPSFIGAPARLVFARAGNTPIRGTVTGVVNERLCPANHIVVGVGGRAQTTAVDQLQIRCAPVTITGTGPYVLAIGAPVVLGVTGGNAGNLAGNIVCPANHLANGIAGRSSTLIHAVGVRCMRPRVFRVVVNTGATTQLSLVGNVAGGGAFSDDCPLNHVLVGVNTVYNGGNSSLSQLRGVCRPISGLIGSGPWTVAHGTNALLANHGADAGIAESGLCNAGNAVSAFAGNASALVSRIEPVCSTAGVTVAGASTLVASAEMPAVGQAAGRAAVSRACAAGSVATGLIGRSGTLIDAFSLRCSPIAIR